MFVVARLHAPSQVKVHRKTNNGWTVCRCRIWLSIFPIRPSRCWSMASWASNNSRRFLLRVPSRDFRGQDT